MLGTAAAASGISGARLIHRHASKYGLDNTDLSSIPLEHDEIRPRSLVSPYSFSRPIALAGALEAMSQASANEHRPDAASR